MSLSYDGKRLLHLMKERGFSMGELARRSGIRQPSIWALCHERVKKPKFDTLAALAVALGVPVQELLRGGKSVNVDRLVAVFQSLSVENQEAVFQMAKALQKRPK